MQRIMAELYDAVLEGIVVDGVPINEVSGDFDQEREFTVVKYGVQTFGNKSFS